MPCYIPDDEKTINDVNSHPYDNKITVLTDKITQLEAGLCAIITELEKRGIANEIISRASRNGLIDLMSFWEKHSKDDEARLAKKFHQFSEHEQNVMRKMMFDKKL